MKKKTRLRDWVESLLFSAVVILILYFAAWPYTIDGSSMEDSFYTGDRIVISRTLAWFRLERGDLVVCTLSDSRDIIKRIVGLPGELVEISEGSVYIDGVILDEDYIKGSFTPGADTVVLGEDQYYLLGDNRSNSMDSRAWGPFSRSDIVGRTVARWYPFSRFTIYL